MMRFALLEPSLSSIENGLEASKTKGKEISQEETGSLGRRQRLLAVKSWYGRMYLNSLVASPDPLSTFLLLHGPVGMLPHTGYINFVFQLPVRCSQWEIPIGDQKREKDEVEILISPSPHILPSLATAGWLYPSSSSHSWCLATLSIQLSSLGLATTHSSCHFWRGVQAPKAQHYSYGFLQPCSYIFFIYILIYKYDNIFYIYIWKYYIYSHYINILYKYSHY